MGPDKTDDVRSPLYWRDRCQVAERENERLRAALRNVRDEMSNGLTANPAFIERQFALLDEDSDPIREVPAAVRKAWEPQPSGYTAERTGLGEYEVDTPEWVRQEHPDGCGNAILAMLTDDTYASVRAATGKDMLTQTDVQDYLTARGWFFRRIYKRSELGAWPPPAFADLHYAIVANPGGAHFVVMDAYGRVLDPLREGFFNLTDWDVVNCVVGLTLRDAKNEDQVSS